MTMKWLSADFDGFKFTLEPHCMYDTFYEGDTINLDDYLITELGGEDPKPHSKSKMRKNIKMCMNDFFSRER